jgi:hypothetical protein
MARCKRQRGEVARGGAPFAPTPAGKSSRRNAVQMRHPLEDDGFIGSGYIAKRW